MNTMRINKRDLRSVVLQYSVLEYQYLVQVLGVLNIVYYSYVPVLLRTVPGTTYSVHNFLLNDSVLRSVCPSVSLTSTYTRSCQPSTMVGLKCSSKDSKFYIKTMPAAVPPGDPPLGFKHPPPPPPHPNR